MSLPDAFAAIGAVLVLVLFGVPAVAAAEPDVVPSVEELKHRVEALYAAEKASDWKTYYELIDPDLRKDLSPEQFIAGAKFEYTLKSWAIVTIERNEQSGLTGAKIAMDVTVQYPGREPERADEQTDYWVFREGHWFWCWRGWPSD